MSLGVNEKKILGYIRDGRNSVACFADNLGIPAPVANEICEELEQNGYVCRVAYLGINRFSWLLTDKGVAELPELDPVESRLLTEGGINISQYKILAYSNENPQALAGEICNKMELNPNEMVSNLSFLVDSGLLNESGLIRRKVSITAAGVEMVKKFSDIQI